MKAAYQQVMQENQTLMEEAVDLAQEIEDLNKDLDIAYSDIAIILGVLKKKKIDMSFVCRLNTISEEEQTDFVCHITDASDDSEEQTEEEE